MPSLNWNVDIWSEKYDWSGGGEEWSMAWGGSEPQWFGTLYPRLHRFLPAGTVLEIAPGYGRWTRFLLQVCDRYVGIDLSPQCVEACRRSFAAAPHARFIQNDGLSLAAADDSAFDLVFSFDSLVHAELDVFAAYIPQILRKLKRTGVAFLHHSNLAPLDAGLGMPHARAVSVSGQKVAELIAEGGGKILVQEKINWWGADDLIDCLTLFGQQEAYADVQSITLTNAHFMDEATLISRYQSPYSTRK